MGFLIKFAATGLLGAITLVGIHIYVMGAESSSRILYPLQSFFYEKTIVCTGDTDNRLKALNSYAINELGTLDVQLAYIDLNADLTVCESGFGRLFSAEKKRRFRVASVTKLITADAILSLVDSGSLSLDSQLGDIFFEIKAPVDLRVKKITIKQLLNHSAGFDREINKDDLMEDATHWCPTNISYLDNISLDFTPGDKTRYSNVAYCILGAVITRITRVPYPEYIEKKYFQKYSSLDFAKSSLIKNEVAPDIRFDEYYNDNSLENLNYHSIESSAGLVANAGELALLLRELIDKEGLTLLSGDSPQDCNIHNFYQCYGFAFYKYQKRNQKHTYFIHGGYLPGSMALVVADKNGKVLVFVGSGAPQKPMTGKINFYLKALDYFDSKQH